MEINDVTKFLKTMMDGVFKTVTEKNMADIFSSEC